MKNILIVEDDINISNLVKYNLEKAGYKCFVERSGEYVLISLQQREIDLVILDIMLTGMDGFEVCKQMKQNIKYQNIPIIMLTARGEEIDRVLGLELGADDYVVKPFSPRELLLRVKSIFKRKSSNANTNNMIEFKGLKIDFEAHRVVLDLQEIPLTGKEFDLLTILIKRKGKVQTRDGLLQEIWGFSSDVTTRTVDTHIKKLRRKLEYMGRNIETVHGIGYRFREE